MTNIEPHNKKMCTNINLHLVYKIFDFFDRFSMILKTSFARGDPKGLIV